MPMKIISYADHPRFRRGAKAVRASLARWGWDGRYELFTRLPEGCPPYTDSPFAFKPHLFDLARRQGQRHVLWLDSSIRVMQDPAWIDELLGHDGYLLIADTGHPISHWSSDASLSYFNTKRVELGAYRSLQAAMMGLDFSNAEANRFLDRWLAAEAAGMFRGAGTNANGETSSNPQVRGHRYDQTCATLIARQMDLEPRRDVDVGVATWPDHPARCQHAQVIIDRGGSYPWAVRCIPQPSDLATGEKREEFMPASTSQLGQDLWVLEQTGFKQGGFFVEFGATDGIEHSNSYLLERRYGWSGICAEPNPLLFEQLKQNRSCRVSDACIAGHTGECVEFILAGDLSAMRSHAFKDGHRGVREDALAKGDVVTRWTVSLHDFLMREGAPNTIDYLSIDTEGSEFEILASFPFQQWDIQLLTVEHNFGKQRTAIRELMQRHGYRCLEKQWDDWYFKESAALPPVSANCRDARSNICSRCSQCVQVEADEVGCKACARPSLPLVTGRCPLRKWPMRYS